jgi:hypothetical protein
MIVNVRTGEVLDSEQLTDEEIVQELKDLETIYDLAKEARDMARNILIGRMEADGAKLRLTSVAKVRLQTTSRVRDRKLVEKLYELCPDELKEKCFKHDLRPLKTGLNELSKLGDDWRDKVDAIYQDSYSLKIEWIEREPDEEPITINIADIDDIPF